MVSSPVRLEWQQQMAHPERLSIEHRSERCDIPLTSGGKESGSSASSLREGGEGGVFPLGPDGSDRALDQSHYR